VIALRDGEPGDVAAQVTLVLAAMDTYVDWMPASWTPPDPRHHAQHWRRQFEARMLDPLARTILALDADRRPVGLAGLTQRRDAAHGDAPIPGVGHIWALFVDPARWGGGVAGGLLRAAEDGLRARGYAHVQLATPEGAPAGRFYESRGYARDGREGWFAPGSLRLAGYTKAL
jgi:GNAT superfamily N-acetyltransferase